MRTILPDQLDHLVSACLSITLHDIVVNQPLFQLRIGPSRPNHVGGIIIVRFHLCNKSIAVFLVARFDDIVRYEPVMLKYQI